MSNRQLALIKVHTEDPDDENATHSVIDSVPLGTLDEVVEALSGYNTSADGSADAMGVLFGPGFTVQLPFVGHDDPVMQILISLDEDEIAWPVLSRICKRLRWKMLDTNTGRTFG